MKIKRFLAKDMRSALQQVRAEHGPDAVILSNRMTDEGIEIVAASHYEQEHVLQVLTESSAAEMEAGEFVPASQPALAVAEAASVAPLHVVSAAPLPTADALADTGLTTPVAVPPAAAPVMPDAPVPAPAAESSGLELPQLRAELMQMRQMFERQMQRLTDERLRGAPECREVMDWMEARGFAGDLIRDIAMQIPADMEAQDIRVKLFSLLTNALPVYPDDLLDEGGILALAGPAGAGKTTTAAKLAAHYSTRNSARDVALIASDAQQRIGGCDLLCHYGHRLGVAVQEVDTGTDLNAALQRVQDYPLVLLDTAGFAQRDRALTGQLNWLRGERQARVLLVLPANLHPADLDEAIRRFQPLNPQGVILTRLDETRHLGSALSVLVEHQLPLAFIADGQRLHDDLHRAHTADLLLRLDGEGEAGAAEQFSAPVDIQHLAA